jgi:hypothetical protein
MLLVPIIQEMGSLAKPGRRENPRSGRKRARAREIDDGIWFEKMLGGILFAGLVSDMGPRTIKMDASAFIYMISKFSSSLPTHTRHFSLVSAKPADLNIV